MVHDFIQLNFFLDNRDLGEKQTSPGKKGIESTRPKNLVPLDLYAEAPTLPLWR